MLWNMTVKRRAAKITHINAQLITLFDEKGGTMQLEGLKNGFRGK